MSEAPTETIQPQAPLRVSEHGDLTTPEASPRHTPGAALAALDLPTKLVDALVRFSEEAASSLGKELVCLALYGSVVRDAYDPERSDLNVLVVTKSSGVGVCDALQTPWSVLQRSCAARLMLVTTTDLESSTDVFPLRFLDIQRSHLIIWGEDVVSGLDIAWDHLRLRVEQEIKQLLFDLRHKYLHFSQGRPEVLGRLLGEKFGAFLVALGALLYLRDAQWWLSGKDTIAAAAVDALGLDDALLERLLLLHRRQFHPSAEQIHTLYDHFLAIVEDVAMTVDRLEAS